MRAIKQFRFYKSGSSKNYPEATLSQYVDGTVFSECNNIQHLGVQALPGTKILINEKNHNAQTYSVMVGYTGILEVDVSNVANIYEIKFDQVSMKLIDENPNTYLIVDIIYDTGD